MTQRGVRVFVYGTLKGMNRGTFIGHGRTVDQFLLFGGYYPVLLESTDPMNPHRGHVLGEVYDVSLAELKQLDSYESYPDLYDRKQRYVQFTVKKGESNVVFKKRCWIYHGNNISLSTHPILPPDANQNLSWSMDDRH